MKAEDYVIKFFKEADLNAIKIPETNERTPDFLITDEVNILVELKEKIDSESLEKQRKNSFDNDEIFERTQILNYRNRMSGVITVSYTHLTLPTKA